MSFLVLVTYGSFDSHYLCAFHDSGEVAIPVFRADTSCHGAVFRESVANSESHHGILVAATFWQFGEELSDDLECVAVVEVIAVDDTEGLFDDVLCHHHCMVSAPWLYPVFRTSESFG